MKIRPSSTAALGGSPLLKPIEPALMPEYNVVHNHCSRTTGDLESGDPFIMQSYKYSPLDVGPAIGFQAPTTHRRVRAPPRKVTDLEKLPPLSSGKAAEIARRVEARERAGMLAKIREAQGKKSEGQKRAGRVAQTRLPSYVAHIPASTMPRTSKPPSYQNHRRHPSYDQNVSNFEPAKTTPGPIGRHADDALVEHEHVRWAHKPVPQRRRDSTALDKKNFRGKESILRTMSRRL